MTRATFPFGLLLVTSLGLCSTLSCLPSPSSTAATPPAIEQATPPDAALTPTATPSPHVEQAAFWDGWQTRWATPPYPLDHLSRAAERNERGKLMCPDLDFESYRGETLRYHKSVKITPAFKPTLQRFEEIAREVALEVYGRAPDRIIHFGTYNCRTIRHRKHRLSEHAFGNAIDIAGFEFRTLPAKERKLLENPRAGKSFKVNVERHWDASRGFESNHATFLKKLTLRLREDDTFRGMIVPPAPGHKNHLHLDMGRWNYLRGNPYPEPEPLIEGEIDA